MPDFTTNKSVFAAALDAVPAHIAILDTEGVIKAVNAGWRKFAEMNGFISGYGVGTNYIHLCERAVGDCSKEASVVAAGIRSVISGSIPSFNIEYPCHSPTEERWFRVMVTPLTHEPGSGVVITHVEVTQRILAELAQIRLNHDLRERIKEISGLHKVSNLLCDDTIEIPDLLKRLCNVIKETVQFPERAFGRAAVLGHEETCEGFISSQVSIRSDFSLSDGSIGGLELVYIESAGSDALSFLAEEQQMLDSMAELVRTTFDGRLAKESLTRTNERFKRQLDELGILSGSGVLENDDLAETFEQITKVTAETVDVDRCSIWNLSQDGSRIIAKDLYIRSKDTHETGTELFEENFPSYFKAVKSHKLIIADDAATHQDTLEFAEVYLAPLGIASMLDAPIVVQGMVAGVVCLEHVGKPRRWTNDEQSFALSIANLVALAIARNERLLSERNLAKAQEIAHLGSWNLDHATGVLSWSEQTYRIFGLSRDEFGGTFESFFASVHSDDREALLQAHEQTVSSEVSLNVEYRIELPSGEVRWVVENGEVVKDKAGTTTGVAGTVIDITDRKKLELEREASFAREQEAKREAVAASQYYRSLFEYAPGCYLVITADDDYKVAAVSDAYQKATMTEREAIYGKRLFDIFPDDPDDPYESGAARVRESLERVKSLGRSDVMTVQRYPIQRPESEGGGWEEKYWSSVNTPVPGPNGKIDFIIHRAEDVTEYVKMKKATGVWDDAAKELSLQTELTEADIILRSHELRQANEQLASNQALLQIAGRAAKLGAWKVKLPERELTWSDETCLIHEVPVGYKPTLNEGMGYYPPEHRAAIRELVEECIENGTPYDIALPKRTAKGRNIWVRTMGEAVRDDDGKIIGLQGAFQDITAQKEAEDSLAESQGRFRQLAESMPFVVWTASPDGRLNFANRRFYEYLGFDDGSLQSAWYKGVLPKDRQVAETEWIKTLEDDTEYDVEYRMRRGSDGSYRWFRVQARATRDAAGNITTWYGTAIDIHVLKELEQNAVRLAKRLTTTFESITDCFFILDREWCFTYVNPEAEKVIGKSREELVAKSFWHEFPEAVGSKAETEYRRAVNEKTSVEFEYSLHGGETWYDVKAYPSDDGLGVYFRNVTEIRKDRERVKESEARFKLLAKATNDSIWDWDLIKDTLWWNEGFEELFGFSRDELEPTIDSWTNRIHPDDKGRVVSDVHRVIDGGADSWSGEYRFARKDGTYAFILHRGHVIHDSNGIAVRMIGGMNDLTDRKNLEEQLLQSQKMEAIGQLAGGVAHDFNNLLTVINGYSDMLLRRDFGDDKAKSALGGINEAGKRAESLTRQLLAFSRRQPLNPSIINLNDLLGSLWKMMDRLIGDDIELDARLPDGISNVKVDPGQYEQVLINLAVNARDAMPNGGHLLIETRNVLLDGEYREYHPEVLPGKYVLTSVSDTGIGMSEEVKSRIFEPFYTTKQVGKGTGLGLATVFGIVKQSGGHISVYSELGHGTTFNIYLPAADSGVIEDALQDVHISETPQGNEIVLLVEDSPSVRFMLKEALIDCGYRVAEAHDGRHALEVVDGMTEKPSIIVSDEVMPRLRGHELAAKMKETHPDCKILLMSGYTEDSVLRRGILDADLAFLQKPFTPSALARKVREVLDK